MPFKVILENNELKRIGRPQFTSRIKQTIKANSKNDRRHILHGATQISNVLIDSFNRILEYKNTAALGHQLDQILYSLTKQGIKYRISKSKPFNLVSKAEKVITIAFNLKQNLAVGSAIANRAIEQARKSVNVIRKELDNYCVVNIRSDKQIKQKLLRLVEKKLVIPNNLKVTEKHEIAAYRRWVLGQLKQAVSQASGAVELIRLLADFEFSCSLDILHEGTSKKQNIWGMETVNKLKKSIIKQDEQEIYKILLGIDFLI